MFVVVVDSVLHVCLLLLTVLYMLFVVVGSVVHVCLLLLTVLYMCVCCC